MANSIHETADVDSRALLGDRTKVWHYAQVREAAVLGADCIVGRGAYIGAGVTLGSGCKVQNYALVYEPASLGDGVFVGPAVVFTNDTFPRATNPDLSVKNAADWTPVGVVVDDGASIGANATCVAPVKIGKWAMVAAGSVVASDVLDYSLVAGVPAKHIKWVGRTGRALVQTTPGRWRCPETTDLFVESEGRLRRESPASPGQRDISTDEEG